MDGVSLCAYAGRITALIGGSGSGKSVMSRSIMGLIDEPGKIVGGEVWLNGRDLRTYQRSRCARFVARKLQ
ncbi:MAG: ATP-binding cassette domain-containing protein [Vescimonas sp.]